jgi:hypothetical protein
MNTEEVNVQDVQDELKQLKKTHVCNENDIQSIKEIRSHSRPCPSCKTKIVRIAGCDTMWCTQCNTGFNWRTGMIINDVRNLHNPHYIEFMRKNPHFTYRPNHPLEEEKKNDATLTTTTTTTECKQQPPTTLFNLILPTYATVIPRIQHLRPIILVDVISNFHQMMGDTRSYALTLNDANQFDEIHYALKYLINDWTEKQWRIRLETHDRHTQVNQEYCDVILTCLIIMSDLFFEFVTNPTLKPITVLNSIQLIKQLTTIVDYTNDVIHQMNILYKRTIHCIGHNWLYRFIHNWRKRIASIEETEKRNLQINGGHGAS